jgi:hypothetical protein
MLILSNRVSYQELRGIDLVRRDLLRGRVWTAAPYRVIRDVGTTLILACRPGVEMLVYTRYPALTEWAPLRRP